MKCADRGSKIYGDHGGFGDKEVEEAGLLHSATDGVSIFVNFCNPGRFFIMTEIGKRECLRVT